MPGPRDERLIVVAVGGKPLRARRGTGAPAEWFGTLDQSLPPLADLVAAGYRLVLTHGNAPQVGDELLRMELARRRVAPLSLDLVEAGTQGSIGYAIQQVLGTLLRQRGLAIPVAAVVTRVVVDPADPAFRRPTTPIGPFYSRTRARRLIREKGWTMVRDARRGYRRVVPSPRPLRILEADLLRALLDGGAIPIAAGGGIPVIEQGQGYLGVEVVIDRDLAAATLGEALQADRLLLLTAVEQLSVNFRKPDQIAIERLTVREARILLGAGEFPPGSMGPKVEAAVAFVEAGGGSAIITSPDRARAAIEGKAGTLILAE